MSRSTSVGLISAPMQKYEPIVSNFCVTLSTGEPTICTAQLGYPVFVGNADTDFTQVLIDAFLGTTSEFAVTTAFGSTAMGTDMFGFVLNCNGQAASAVYLSATLSLVATDPGAVAGVKGNGTVTTVLPDTLTPGLAVTTGGNLYGRIITEGYDGAGGTSLIVSVAWLPK